MAFAATLGGLTDELVEVITSTTALTDPGRFDALRESSLQKIRHHSFLRTNQFEVYSSFDGYEERFRVLNRDGLADALRERLDELAPCSNNFTPEVLHLLLLLADQPVQKSSLKDLESLREPEEEPEPQLKWSDIAKEEGWDQDDELWRNADFGGYSSDDGYPGHASDGSVHSEGTSLSSIEARYRKQPTDYVEALQGELDLEKVRESQSWRNKMLAVPSSPSSEGIGITEIQAVREILFMLSGLENSLFDHKGKPSPKLQLSHTSSPVFKSILASASDAGKTVSLLRQYISQPQEIPLLQVFQEAIAKHLRSFDNILAGMQAPYVCTDKDFVASVMVLFHDLEPHLRLLRCLAKTIEQLRQSKTMEPFHYLELLYDSAQALQLQGDEHVYQFIGHLFFECFEVYLRPIRLWMESGGVTDNDKTFFISSSPVDVPRSQVWTDQFKLKKTAQGVLFAPRFLQPAVSKIFTTGKSVVILKLLGKHCTHNREPEPATRIDLSTVSHLEPFSEVFKNMFDRWMQSKHHAASTTLRQAVFQTCNLWSDLDALRCIYLMSDGARSDLFANAVFNNIDILNVYWHDRFNLTEMAREAFHGLIESHRLSAGTSLNASVSNVKDVRRTIREGLPSIRITCRLPWLSRIILTDESLDHYQLVFTFLLQLRRASKALIRHRVVSDGMAAMTGSQATFYGLRSKLLWFCNTLQSYLSTLVLGPLVGKLQEEMRQAEDIDHMLTSHSAFAKRMTDEACLGSKLDPIRQAMLDIFNLAIRLQDARGVESERLAEETQELSRLSVMSLSRRKSPERHVKSSEEEDETFLSEQDKSDMVQDTEIPYDQVLGEIRSDFDRHLKFICGGLRGVARASGSEAASKWDILAEMLEAGV
ncbi:Spc98 family-domain-containing protein [Xylaria sp. CBS 124048]|nr:Spc98 family-domain-containing protein [Xylaria sp. CBS 124048]